MDPSSSSSWLSKRKRDPDSFDDDDDEPAESCKRPKYDVFLNYSFEDIGNSFVSHLKEALFERSFTVSDHTMLSIGQDVDSELLKAIEESEIYVLLFSPKYASSRKSLDELLNIMGSFHKLDNRKVLPVFFYVDPSHVRHQQGKIFMDAFQAHNSNIDPNRVQQWRQALKDAGQLSGLTFQNGDESKFVRKIVKELEKMQRPQALHVTDHPVGIGSRAEELISTLRLDLEGQVLVVAVFGIGGIGKTTIVKEAYNRIASSFDLSVFIADIHTICQASPYWKVKLQKALLRCLNRNNKFSIMSNHNEGVTKIRRLVWRRKVLLVLDDIDNFQQLESLSICPKYFYEGSRIIVTTRDKGSVRGIPYVPYHTELLNRRESLNLCTRLMFSRDDPEKTKIIEEVVGRAGGLPMVLKVWSRHFKYCEREKWPSILETMERIPHGDVQKQLQLSYDSLTNRAKMLFLDIVCFFNYIKEDDTKLIGKELKDGDSILFPTNEMQYLADKFLLEVRPKSRYNKIWMHRAIREMGQEIVRQENEEEPGQRTRLWKEKDVMQVLRECSGTESVESIILSYPIPMMQEEVTVEALRKMSNLRLIKFGGSILPHDGMTHLCFKKLKYMFWNDFPFKSFDNIDMGNIVVLKVWNSKLEKLWEGIKSLRKLRILEVSESVSLTKTGDFSGLENLEELELSYCRNLKELHHSIGCLQKLDILDLRGSIPLNMIPWEMISKLASLRKLSVGSSTLEESEYLRKVVGDADCSMELEPGECNDYRMSSLNECPLTERELWKCNTSNISGGDGSLAWLKDMWLHKAQFNGHPDSLLQLHRLNVFQLIECDTILWIPNLPRNVTTIDLILCQNLVTGLMSLAHLTINKCSISQVPNEIGNLVSLKQLDISENTFTSLPDSLSNLSQLIDLNINYCRQLRWLPLVPLNLTYVHASECNSLDVQSPASICIKAWRKESSCSRFVIELSCKEVPGWCRYQNTTGDILSFVAPVALENNICGIILCSSSHTYESDYPFILKKMHNKTKNTSHCFVTEVVDSPLYRYDITMYVQYYPLDDTTLSVEPGDSVALQLQSGHESCGLRLIYESDVRGGW